MLNNSSEKKKTEVYGYGKNIPKDIILTTAVSIMLLIIAGVFAYFGVFLDKLMDGKKYIEGVLFAVAVLMVVLDIAFVAVSIYSIKKNKNDVRDVKKCTYELACSYDPPKGVLYDNPYGDRRPAHAKELFEYDHERRQRGIKLGYA